jgi:Tetratricopeptide repeat
MTWRRIGIMICAGLIVPGLAAAQNQPGGRPPARMASAEQDRELKAMYEDIETMRRILNRAVSTQQMSQCASCHGGSGVATSAAVSPDGKFAVSAGMGQGFTVGPDDRVIRLWDVNTGRQLGVHPPVPHPFTGAEGTYLRGVGVVFAMTLPIAPEGVHEAPRKSAPPKTSDWERVHRQVLGEPGEPGAVRERPVQPSLREIILKTLSENGRHFTHLGPSENLTVVVTFRGGSTQRLATGGIMGGGGFGGGIMGGFGGGGGGLGGGGAFGGGGGGFGGGGKKGGGGGASFGGFPGGASSSGGGGGPPGAAEALADLAGTLTNPNSVRDYELLGDLVLKQGKVDEAIQAYKKAVNMNPDNNQLASLYRKLAQAYLARSQDSSALEALQKALSFVGKEAIAKTPPKAPKSVSNLPAQLVISVPKSLAEQYAAGMIPFDRFREAAHVELRKFSDPAH